MRDNVEAALDDLGQNLDTLLAHEQEPGPGNSGLRRLAACYMDSLTTLKGIRYEFGLFNQKIQNGWRLVCVECTKPPPLRVIARAQRQLLSVLLG